LAYYKTLLDPFTHRGGKIPDSITADTTTCSMYVRGLFTLSSAGAGGVMLNANSTASLCVVENPETTSDSSFTYLGSSTPFPGASAFKDLYASSRIVSGGIRIQATGTPLSQKGLLTSGYVNRDAPAPDSLTALQTTPGSTVVAFAHERCSQVNYRPLDAQDNDFVPPNTVDDYLGQFDPVSAEFLRLGKVYDSEFAVNITQSEDSIGPIPGRLTAFAHRQLLLLHVSGGAANDVVSYEAVLNFECRPRTIGIDVVRARASPQDPVGLATVSAAVSRVPRVKTSPFLEGLKGVTHAAISSLGRFAAEQTRSVLVPALGQAVGKVGSRVVSRLVDGVDAAADRALSLIG